MAISAGIIMFTTGQTGLIINRYEDHCTLHLCSWPSFYPLLPEPLQAAVWSSTGSALALVKQNNIFYMRSINHKMEEVTSSGTVGGIYHGVTDWLYRGK